MIGAARIDVDTFEGRCHAVGSREEQGARKPRRSSWRGRQGRDRREVRAADPAVISDSGPLAGAGRSRLSPLRRKIPSCQISCCASAASARATPASRIVRLALDGRRSTMRRARLPRSVPPDRADRVPYSLASAPEETARDGYLEFLIKVDAAGAGARTSSRCGAARGSRCADRRGPSCFRTAPRERRFLFIAGGTGIAPLRSMIRHAALSGIDGNAPPALQRAHAARFRVSAGTAGDGAGGEVELALSATREVPPRWRGDRGRIAPAQLARLLDHPGNAVFRVRACRHGG